LQKYWIISVWKRMQFLEKCPILNLFDQRAQKPLFFTQLEGEVMKSQIGSNAQTAEELQKEWDTNPRWAGIKRDYTAEDVVRLRGSITEDSTLARRGAENLWDLLHTEKWVAALGALTGNQAVQQVKAGLKGDLPFRMAGCRRCQPFRPYLPRSKLVSRQLGSGGCPQN
jgi:hypothetical protein